MLACGMIIFIFRTHKKSICPNNLPKVLPLLAPSWTSNTRWTPTFSCIQSLGKVSAQITPVLLLQTKAGKFYPSEYGATQVCRRPKGENYVPLAPTFTSTGGLFYKPKQGWNGSISHRGIKSRPAIEDGSITAKGYFIVDGAVNYLKQEYKVGFAIENLLNAEWNEAQFATLTRLRNEQAPVNELHFTPDNPFFFKAKLAVFF